MEGNQMKMREALEQAFYFLRRHHMGAVYAPDGETLIFCEDVINIVDKALSSSPRNCDVGTAEEQAERMRLYCKSHGVDESRCFRCKGCPLLTADICELSWAQMPYEAQEGDGK